MQEADVRTRSEGGRPTRFPTALVRPHDAYPVWTWIALTGLVIAALLAVLGLLPVDLHGPLHHLGVMDPLCGGTRSVYLTMHGQLREAVRYNPAGPALVAGAVGVLIRAGVGRATGYWVGVPIPKRILIPVALVALAALEANQQLHAVLLTQPWGGS
jgi:hypothetical protein